MRPALAATTRPATLGLQDLLWCLMPQPMYQTSKQPMRQTVAVVGKAGMRMMDPSSGATCTSAANMRHAPWAAAHANKLSALPSPLAKQD